MFSLRKFSLRRSIDGENIDLKKRLKPGNFSCIETFYLKAHRSNQQQGINNVWQFIVYVLMEKATHNCIHVFLEYAESHINRPFPADARSRGVASLQWLSHAFMKVQDGITGGADVFHVLARIHAEWNQTTRPDSEKSQDKSSACIY